MMQWIVHVGVQKTGSKAIQHFLAEEDGRGPEARFCFPEQGRAGIWHYPMFVALSEGNTADLDAAVAVHAGHPTGLAILSYEGLHTLSSERIRLVRERVGAARVVLFIRRQDDAIDSMLNQYVKAHRVGYEQIAAYERTLDRYDPAYDYRTTIDRWARIFGSKAIVPIVYDKRTDAVRLFCEAIGLAYSPRDRPNPNPALSRTAYAAFRDAKAAVKETSDLPRVVADLHAAYASEMTDTMTEPGPQLIDDDRRRRIMRLYEASNESVRAEFFPHRSDLFDAPDRSS